VESLLTLTASELANYGPNLFTVTASIAGDSDTKTVTILRAAPPGLSASFTASPTNPCANFAPLSTVQFTDTSTGAILSWSWDLDGDGLTTDANVADPLYDYLGFTPDVPVNVTLIVSDGVVSSSTSMIITPVTCL
jgi:PKD repeat protein